MVKRIEKARLGLLWDCIDLVELLLHPDFRTISHVQRRKMLTLDEQAKLRRVVFKAVLIAKKSRNRGAFKI